MSTYPIPPIEARSYKMLREDIDRDHPFVASLPPLSRAVMERVVHATGDPDIVTSMVCDEDALVAGRQAILAGAEIITDVRMTAAGLPSKTCAIDLIPTAPEGSTRSYAGMEMALKQATGPVIVAVGCSPTSVWALLDLIKAGMEPPVLTVATPVGYVDAVESKLAVQDAGIPWVGNTSRRGGAAMASAIVNALRYHPRHLGDELPTRPLTV